MSTDERITDRLSAPLPLGWSMHGDVREYLERERSAALAEIERLRHELGRLRRDMEIVDAGVPSWEEIRDKYTVLDVAHFYGGDDARVILRVGGERYIVERGLSENAARWERDRLAQGLAKMLADYLPVKRG